MATPAISEGRSSSGREVTWWRCSKRKCKAPSRPVSFERGPPFRAMRSVPHAARPGSGRTRPVTTDESELLTRLRIGDDAAYEESVRTYSPRTARGRPPHCRQRRRGARRRPGRVSQCVAAACRFSRLCAALDLVDRIVVNSALDEAAHPQARARGVHEPLLAGVSAPAATCRELRRQGRTGRCRALAQRDAGTGPRPHRRVRRRASVPFWCCATSKARHRGNRARAGHDTERRQNPTSPRPGGPRTLLAPPSCRGEL